MSSPRYSQLEALEAKVKEAEEYGQARLVEAKTVLITLTSKIATMNDQEAVVEVKKAYAELKAIKSDIDAQTQKLLAGLPVSLISSSQRMRNISYDQELIDQRLDALRWIVRGSDLADKLDQGKANLNEINLKRDWDFARIQREDSGLNQLHHTRISPKEGGDILNALLSRVSKRVTEAAEDTAMLIEVGKLKAKEEQEKKVQMETAAKEAREREVAVNRTTLAGIAAKAAAAAIQHQIAVDAIKGCVEKIENSLNNTGFQANKKVGVLGKSALDKKADEIRRLCARARLSPDVNKALVELSQAAELLNQSTKTFFGKKDLPCKTTAFTALHELQKALPEKYKHKLTSVSDPQPVSQPVRRV